MASDPKNVSPMARLPQKKEDGTKPAPQPLTPPTAPPQKEKPVTVKAKPEKTKRVGPIFWTVTSIITTVINLVVLIILLVVLAKLREERMTDITKIAPDLLGGLYENFEKMDSAHITKTIPVDATIPVKFDLQLNQQTSVVLSEDVLINNALVTVNTGGLNINRAAANIILPQGTSLPVFLSLTVPVDTTIPVKLNVAVDIPLNETQLHEPFVGLQEVIAPLYCLVKSDAKGISGQAVCK